jgi:transketolase
VHGPHKISEEGVDTPVYIRLAREKSPVITTEETPFAIGKAQVFFELDTDQFIALKSSKGGEGAATFKLNSDHDIRHDVGVVACGALVHKAIVVAKKLEAEGIAVKVLNLSTIKPLDVSALVALAKETGAIVTVEEHQIAGGVGSAVAEAVVQNLSGGEIPPFEFVGVRDVFGQSGTPEEVIQHYGMGEDHIEEAVRKVITRKK